MYSNHILHKFINKLPQELIEIIRRITYKTQPKELLNDISHYHSSKKKVKEIYYNLFIRNSYDLANLQDIGWLENNITLFANFDIPTSYLIHKYHYNIFMRLYVFRNLDDNKKKKKRIKKFINYVNDSKEYMLKRINIYWGLMNNEERSLFIENYSSIIY